MKAKGYRQKLISYGPGGYKCPCCGPTPKHRQKERRHLRKVERRFLEVLERRDADAE
jgi:tRNA(Ile2) C34 agmatinyltransferase TiaS